MSDSTKYEPASGSGVSVTPLSWARICWVRSARRALSSVGSASASSRAFVWRLWAPPSTADSAWTVVRTTLLSIDWAVSDEPAVWTWNRQAIERSLFAPNRSRTIRAHIRRAARNLATSSNSSDQAAKKNDRRGAKSSIARPAGDRRLAVGDRVGERERELLGGRRPRLAHVVARDRDRVPARQLLRAELEDVGHEAHRRPRRVDPRPAGDVLLEDVVLGRARDPVARHALLLGGGRVEREQDRRRRVDRHRRADLAERQAVEQDLHVGERADRDADPADLPRRLRRVRVVAHLGRQVERDRQARLALLEEVAEAAVRLLGGREARVLAHRPEPRAVHRGLDAAGERVLAREAEVGRRVEAERGEVVGGVDVGDLEVASSSRSAPAAPGPIRAPSPGSCRASDRRRASLTR